jgi:GNAT superfamily N-acetyltransferase
MKPMAAPTHLDPVWAIRPFGRGDAPAVRWLIESVWREHFHDHPDSFVRDFIYSRLSDVDDADTVYADRGLFLCAIAAGEVVGTGALKRCDDRVCEMVRMFVAPIYRGRGIARTIANGLISFAGNAGYDRIRLSSNNALTASHRLYEGMGFQLTASWDPGGEAHSRYYVLRID